MENLILSSKDDVRGEIYCIRNKDNGKCYIGQTLTHRLNHRKYRPYGYLRRFASHCSEALCDRKKNQCTCVADAIRQYGLDKFEVLLLCRCDIHELDDKEAEQILVHNSMYPNGYNLAKGGKSKYNATDYTCTIVIKKQTDKPVRDASRSHSTRKLISERLNEYHANNKEEFLATAQKWKDKWLTKKMQQFQGVHIDINSIDSYIHQAGSRIIIKVADKYASFASKFDSIDDKRKQAKSFLENIIKINADIATSPN